MSVSVKDFVVYHYEKQPFAFTVGELLHDFNGNETSLLMQGIKK